MGEGLNQAGSAAWNYGGKQTLLPAANAMDSIPTFAIGAANTVGGAFGNVISGLGYGVGAATDALGATTGGKQWVADNMWKHTNNAVHAGLQDMVGSVADAATGGAYDYNGTFADPGKHPGTAVQQNRSAIRDELRQTAGPAQPRTNRGGVRGRGMGAGAMPFTAEQVFNTINGVSDFAASSAGFGGAGRGVNVAAKALKGAPQVAPLLNAAANTPVAGKPLAAAGNWLAGKAPEANMFAKSPLGYYQSMFGQNPAYAAMGAASEAGEIAYHASQAGRDPLKEQQLYDKNLPQLARQYAEATQEDHAARGIAHTHAMTNAMMQDPAIQNRIGHGAVPPETAALIAHEQLPPTPDNQVSAEQQQAFEAMSANAKPSQKTLAGTANTQAAGGQMNVADPTAATQQPTPPAPDEFAAQVLPDASPEERQQVVESASTVQQAAADNPDVVDAVRDPTGDAAKKLEPAAFENLRAENAADAPTDNPNAYGDWMNGLMTQFNEMDPMAKVALGLGLGTGVIGLISGLMGGGIGSFLLGALGLGAAGFMGANAGMFGQDAQTFTQDAMFNVGSALGMLPQVQKDQLTPLLQADPIKALSSQAPKIDRWSAGVNPAEYAKKIGPQVQQAEAQLKELQKIVNLRPQQLAQITKGLSVEEAQVVLNNARVVLADAQNPQGQLGAQLALARAFMADPEGVRNREMEKNLGAVGAAAGRLVADGRNAVGQGLQNTWDYFTNRDDKRSSDMNIAQRIIIEELTTKAARCWAGYEPVPGKKPYSDGSCRPVGSKKKKKKKTEKKAAGPVLPQSASPPVQSFSETPFDAQHMVRTLGMHPSTKPKNAYQRAMYLWRKNKFTRPQFQKLYDKYQGLPPRPPEAHAPVAAPQSSAEQAYQQWQSQQGL